MKIQESAVKLQSDHHLAIDHTIKEKLEIWTGRNPNIQRQGPQVQGPPGHAMISITREAFMAFEATSHHESEAIITTPSGSDGSKLMQTKMLLEKLLGQKFEMISIEQREPSDIESPEKGRGNRTHSEGNTEGQPEFGIEYEYHERYHEEEHTSFHAEGTVRTESGHQIQFNLAMSMDREYLEEHHIQFQAGNAVVDPLVINFSGRPAALQDETTEFDLDSDGTQETIHKLAPTSGYLVYDKNGDGVANNGGELFGPSTGSGFTELAMHDQDDNGWIDENDQIFGKLSIWTQGETDSYQSLLEAGIGAIYLDHATTEFQMNDAANQTKGVVKETGIYLEENGQVGSVQEIGLAVK